MSTRKRNEKASAKTSEALPSEGVVHSKDDLPTRRPQKGAQNSAYRTTHVSPPFSNVSLTNFIYCISCLAVLYLAVQTYRIFQWKTELGGWWNLAMGKSPAAVHKEHQKQKFYDFTGAKARKSGIPKAGGGEVGDDADVDGAPTLSVEDRINELAEALGMPSKDLASAIAVAVREYVPPASLSSVAAEAAETGASDVVEELLGEGAGGKAKAPPSGTGILDKVVGMDEPPAEMA
ncbi:hypothetical protein PUNSTDRAFT_128502 [Punctularia strigosozonata HHB-11173 SS5]|uniref:Uncharacterized protein n=1 Tax=Punctularia strigosozonata (strain HHB-11173) TaxID=741275 RepID=R7S326_PUNST|nr:uncharacterized protein PUNSTDRAFT_128502 [Punctularia strigosozonata HHB-11173 SS5]EIN04229.1 hypothetical protein PUNSTDRAFT_128502 [Punctularia strigosozonata HHB-11173 SS5]